MHLIPFLNYFHWVLLLVTVLVRPMKVDGTDPLKNLPVVNIVEGGQDGDLPPSGESNITRSLDGQLIIFEVPTTVYNLNILCDAPYPVSWSYDISTYHAQALWNVRIGTARKVKDVFDHTTFNYTSLMAIYGESNRMSGQYFCRSTRDTNLTTNIHIFWSGIISQYLVLAQETITLNVDTINYKNIILPCFVSSPNIKPILLKYPPEGKIELHTNDSISFDPKIGFTLSNLPDPSGKYKCITNPNNFEMDFVVINVPVKPGTPAEPTPPIIVGNSTTNSSTKSPVILTTPRPKPVAKSTPTLVYNSQRQELVCCSGTKKSPTINNYFCNQPVICALGTGQQYSRFSPAGFGRITRKNGCATYKLQFHSSGLVTCVGQDNDFCLHRNYIFPFTVTYSQQFQRNRHLDPYSPPKLQNKSSIPVWFSWNEIVPEEMMIVQSEMGEDGAIFEGQPIRVDCQISSYYFSSGIHWSLKYKNDTIKIVDGLYNMGNTNWNDDIGFVRPHKGHFDFLDIIADEQLDSIICMAPVWNSSYWVNKAFHPYVNKSIASTMVNVSDVNPTWYMNDTQRVISCNASGSPPPDVSWTKDNQTLLNGTNVEIVHILWNTTVDPSLVGSVLTVHRVSHGSSGVYGCHAKNLGGTASGSFTVKVQERASWKVQITIIVGVLVGLVLLTVTGFLAWKVRQGQLALQSHTGVLGEDRITTSDDDGFHTDYHNSTFDPSSLNGDLLE